MPSFVRVFQYNVDTAKTFNLVDCRCARHLTEDVLRQPSPFLRQLRTVNQHLRCANSFFSSAPFCGCSHPAAQMSFTVSGINGVAVVLYHIFGGCCSQILQIKVNHLQESRSRRILPMRLYEAGNQTILIPISTKPSAHRQFRPEPTCLGNTGKHCNSVGLRILRLIQGEREAWQIGLFTGHLTQFGDSKRTSCGSSCPDRHRAPHHFLT